jgi:hypothetical protein
MRAINHAMTGALIGLVSGQPAVALPAALVSHFVLDAIPHHASAKPDAEALRSKWFAAVLLIDAGLCGLLVLTLAVSQPLHWQLAAVCAFLAASPDFLFVDRYVKSLRNQPARLNRLVQWTRDIQWFQRPIGAVVEVAWFTAAVVLLLIFIS